MSLNLIQENIGLKNYNTFGIESSAKYFANVWSKAQLIKALNFASEKKIPFTVLGGGSNVLLTNDNYDFIIHNLIGGIENVKNENNEIYLRVGGGVSWHTFVMYCVERNYSGVENLSLIPGSVGASPMQNIGAYGVEIKDVFESLTALELSTGKEVIFNYEDCAFGYRESIFKNKLKGKFIILDVTFKLSKIPEFNISYGAIKNELEAMGVKYLSIKAISNAVINIRRSKLPDPYEIGNAGSFFKNPEIENKKFQKIFEKFPGIVGYDLNNGKTKLAAGWLIENCGWKGFRSGDAGCHKKQALVLVNYGEASGLEILSLSNKIIESVKAKFDVELEREVNIL
ncbi:MAG: UDP-N-acetylmuramate dehydrogenase [Ferruginibacter sp.]